MIINTRKRKRNEYSESDSGVDLESSSDSDTEYFPEGSFSSNKHKLSKIDKKKLENLDHRQL